MIPYKEQFDKLTRAYIENKVNPYESCACFVGNLLDGNSTWSMGKFMRLNAWETPMTNKQILEQSKDTYTLDDILDLEDLFMSYVRDITYKTNTKSSPAHELWENPTPEMEDTLFIAFEKTLEALKMMHISKGEKIDEAPVFKKRQLTMA